MRAFLLLSFGFIVVAGLQVEINAQEIAKIRDEYFDNPIRRYQPNDPWHRSILYRLQTGHYGRFYNCDNEEQKRCSPYICWKNSDCPTIPKKNCLDCINDEIFKVKRRICDGAGPCCCAGQSPEPHQSCSCAQCAAAQTQRPNSQVARSNIFQSAPQNVAQAKAQPCDCQECRAKSNKNVVDRNQSIVDTSNRETNVAVANTSNRSNLLSRLKQQTQQQQGPVVLQAQVAPADARTARR